MTRLVPINFHHQNQNKGMSFNAMPAWAMVHAAGPSYGNSHRWLTKLLRIMRLMAIILFACAMQVTAKTHSQTVTLQAKNIPLETALNELRAQTGFDVFYDYELIRNAKPVTINANKL